jgi:starch phosphorylase
MNKAVTPERTIPKPRPGGLDPDSIVDAFAYRMMYSVARDQFNATDLDAFQALAFAVRDRLMERWFATQDTYYRSDAKRVYYLSLEFLLGRLLVSNVINLGAKLQHVEAMKRLGFILDDLAERESDAGLGNGGLGRLAACFLDSASTLGIPFYGYGIRYEYGIFRQRIVDGQQTENPDNWLRYGNPWEVPRPDVCFPVRFYGKAETYKDENNRERYRWADFEQVYAMAYDIAVPGYKNNTVNSLRLWAAKSSREFDLAQFNAGAYVAAVEDKNRTENISKVLYPPDDQYAGKELRLKQQYFFTSATIQDVIRRFKKFPGRSFEELPDKVAIQLNDTHPAIAIPEMMRVLVDEEALDWDRAWWICERVFAYTNHTVLPEALETWPKELVSRLLPRHWQIIEEIDRRFRASVADSLPDKVDSMAVIDRQTGNVRMAHLAIVGSHSVNGVARLHTEILKTRIFRDFDEFFPRKFSNRTNGITPRRWLAQCNPELAALITETIGDGWPNALELLGRLDKFAGDGSFRARWAAVKHVRKDLLAKWLRKRHAVDVDVESLFDVQIKRIHEYKRQLLNVLHTIALYHRIKDGADVVPRTVILAGKAAPSYAIAKLIIRLIHDVAAMARKNRKVSDSLKIVFVPNYDVSAAEMLFPATELSEQISTAGTEASGTGCMKAVFNGGVIIGTLDGANIEIRQEVGAENIFIFGNTTPEVEALRANGYNPMTFIEANPELKRVIETIASLGHGAYKPIVDILTHNDRYLHCADFGSYAAMQEKAAATWMARDEWNRMSVVNTARSAYFSADRTIADYARDIWFAAPVPVTL